MGCLVGVYVYRVHTCIFAVIILFLFPQIALAKGVLTSSIGVRVRRFFGFALGGLSGRVSSKVSSDVCMACRFIEEASRPGVSVRIHEHLLSLLRL